jgi:Reverse transcriptase (RNA-dependent DNA polymerase)
LDEPVYLKIPQGLQYFVSDLNPKVDCLLLNKAIYGLVQAARQWWRKFITMLVNEFRFTRSQADACVLIRTDSSGTIMLCIYVDDALMVGDQAAINKTVEQLRSKVTLKEVGCLAEYVGCTIIREGTNNKLWMCQPNLIVKMERIFEKHVSFRQTYKTPAAPGEIISKPTDDTEKVDGEMQRLYRSGVGMLLYLIKFSRPEISNAVREIAKVMDGPTQAHMKSLFRLVKYVIDTKHFGLVMMPEKPKIENTWELQAFCDSDYAGDRDGRKSISGFIIYVQGCPISWKSKGQKAVTLSSSEAEYVAISEVCAEIMFLKQILEFLKIQVTLPIIVRVDNVGAIYLAHNAVSGPRMKHVDIRYHFVRDYIEEGVIKIIFVKSEENDSDIYTKNLGDELFKKHSKKYIQPIFNDGKGVGVT